MRKTSRALAVIAVSFLTVGLLSNAQAATTGKAGAVCKPKGATINSAAHDILVCTAVGKKLIWKISVKHGSVLKIGVVDPLSGTYAPEGGEIRRGYEMAVAAYGGYAGGRKIQLIFGDASDSAGSISETTRLITQQKVEMLVGAYTTTISLATSETAARYNKVFIDTHALTDSLTKRGLATYFRVGANATDFGQESARFLIEDLIPKLGKSVFIEHEQGLYGTSVGDAQVKVLQASGATVAVGTHSPAATDVTDSVLAAKAANPDIWMLTGYNPDDILLLNTAASLNFHPKAIVLVGAGDTNAVYKGVGAKNLTDTFVVAYTSPIINPKYAPGNPAFYQSYQAKFSMAPLGTVANTGFTGMTAALKLIDAAKGKVTPAAIKLAGTKVRIPFGGQPNGWGLQLDATGQNTMIRLVAVQWRANGTVPAIWPAAAAAPGQMAYLPGN